MKKFGLAPTMMTGTGTSFQDGLIRKELHDKFETGVSHRHRHVRRARLSESDCAAG